MTKPYKPKAYSPKQPVPAQVSLPQDIPSLLEHYQNEYHKTAGKLRECYQRENDLAIELGAYKRKYAQLEAEHQNLLKRVVEVIGILGEEEHGPGDTSTD